MLKVIIVCLLLFLNLSFFCSTVLGANAGVSAGGLSCNPKSPVDAAGNPQGTGGVWTAIGCIPTNPTELIQGLIKVAIGAGGGIAFLLMLAGVFQLMTSSGNPDALKKGADQITNAAIGLLFIIFSVLLLKIIGVDILQIEGFIN